MENIQKNISKQFLWIIIFSGIFLFWADRVKAEERVVARNYPCSNETQCKNMCVGEDITVIERTTGSGGKDYYCNKGYVSGSIAAGEKCEKQSDCSAGLYCHNGTFRNTCEQKMQDETTCTTGGISPKLDNCENGCLSAKYYQSVADAHSGAVVYACGEDPNKKSNAEDLETISSQIADGLVPGSTDTTRGIVPCGRGGQRMCTLCDLIVGIHVIIKFIMKIAIGVALLAIAIGGVMYVVSAGDSGAVETAKATIKSALIGFIVIFAAWIIVNTVMTFLSANSTLGMKSTTSWQNFECNATNK